MASPGDPPLSSSADPAATSPPNPVDPTLTSPNIAIQARLAPVFRPIHPCGYPKRIMTGF
ncbi:hypothetical protein LguiB_026512 [Lonicera macranthoides]